MTKPFSGNSGRLLDRILMENDIGRDSLYLTNLLHCPAPDNASPSQAEIKACKVNLQKEIDEVKPKFIILLGAVALKGVLGKGEAGIMDIHGTPIEKDGITYLPTFHPAAALRDVKKEAPLKSDFKRFFEIINGTWKPSTGLNLEIVRNSHAFEDMIKDLQECPVIGFDLETSGLDQFEPEGTINCLGISRYKDKDLTDEKQYILPMPPMVEDCPFPVPSDMGTALFRIWETMKGKKIITQNGKFDNLWLRAKWNIRFPITYDTMMAAHILDENSPCGLKYLAKVHLNAPAYDLTSDQKRGQVDPELLYKYCGYDVLYTLRLYKYQRDQLLKQPELLKLFKFLIMPSFEAFEDIEFHGVYLHRERLEALEIELKAKLTIVAAKLEAMSPGTNWGSPKQVGKILFETWGLVPLEKTPSGANSTAEGILQRLKGQHEGIDLLLSHRELSKQISSFVEGWKRFIDSSGRMHPSFKLHGTVTGRLCLREDTEIMVPGKTKLVQEINPGDLVYTYDDELKLTLKKVKSSGFTGNKPCYRVHWVGQGGHTEGFLDATGNHPIRLTSGSYIKVEDLSGGKYVKRIKRYHGGEHVLALHRYIGEYSFLHCTGEKARTKESRIIFESLTGISPEHIHHKDGNKLNDAIENLAGETSHDHTSHHACRNSDEMRRRGVDSGGLAKARIGSEIVKQEKYQSRFTIEQIEKALIQGNGVVGAHKILKCSYWALRRRIEELGFNYDGRTCTLTKLPKDLGVKLPNNHMITFVEKLPGEYPVYDIEVEDTHNFIANELCVHNSCSDPNLQQVPREKSIRTLIGAPKGWKFLECDYSQVELRIAAMASGDPTMLEIFNNASLDIHRRTASLITGKPEAEVTKDERKKAKACNFGFLYGMSAKKFQEYARDKYQTDLTQEEAITFRNKFFTTYAGLPKWHQKQKIMVRQYGQIRNHIGRVRHLPEILSQDEGVRAQAERNAINSPVQSFASDITQMAVIALHQKYGRDVLNIVGTVHDAILIEIREDVADQLLPEIKKLIEHPPLLDKFEVEMAVPLVTDTHFGDWGSE